MTVLFCALLLLNHVFFQAITRSSKHDGMKAVLEQKLKELNEKEQRLHEQRRWVGQPFIVVNVVECVVKQCLV